MWRILFRAIPTPLWLSCRAMASRIPTHAHRRCRTPFPGLLALVTGGSPISHGLFYDVSYGRTIFDPTNITCAGSPGNMMVFDESIDLYNSSNVSLNVIDPTKLPRILDAHGNCVPLFPHSALRTNTIFEVVKASGGHTAWADKHPAYDLVNGPSGTGVDDLYTPEITNVNGFDATVSVVCTAQNDQLKVNAIINEIHGLRHECRGPSLPRSPMPRIADEDCLGRRAARIAESPDRPSPLLRHPREDHFEIADALPLASPAKPGAE